MRIGTQSLMVATPRFPLSYPHIPFAIMILTMITRDFGGEECREMVNFLLIFRLLTGNEKV